MLAEDVFRLKGELAQRNTLFAYAGPVSEALLASFGESVKQQLALKNADRNRTRRVFAVFVEQVQNVIRYSEEQDLVGEDPGDRLSSGVVAVGLEEDRFFVICGNNVSIGGADLLQERLTYLASLNEEELKAHYRTKLRSEPEEQSEGGTIGLIEIARRASQPLEFDFLETGDGSRFFVLKAFV
jgi:hypothetical protein